MIDGAGRLDLAREPRPARGVVGEARMEAFHGDGLAGAAVGRTPDLGHPSVADVLVEAVATAHKVVHRSSRARNAPRMRPGWPFGA